MPQHKDPTGGYVALIGAGPGDPELLTRKAYRWLTEADVVLHDHLVSRDILDLIPTTTRRIDVGKIPGGKQTNQELIHRLLVREAQNGLQVARLKGGDPFVFGRGAEEAAHLAAHRIPYEIVPGISSSIAAPAVAGIPVTHRQTATHFSVIAARSCSDDNALIPSWRTLAAADGTLVFLMGVARLPSIVEAVLSGGRPGCTPCAIIERGTTPDQRVIEGTLQTIVAEARIHQIRPPATIVIGDVVDVRHTLESSAAYDSRPIAAAQ